MPNDSEVLRHLLQAETRGDSGGRAPVASLLAPGLTVLAHPDLVRVGERAILSSLPAGREELISRREPQFSAPGSGVLRPLADPYLSRRPLQLTPGPDAGSIRLSCHETSTAATAGGRPVEGESVFSAAEVERGVVLTLANRVVLLLSLLDPVGPAGLPGLGLVGESAGMLQLRREIVRVAPLGVPVLLRGETGTGKELVAQALHQTGSRRLRPFFAVSMAAVPATLAAAELFGAARGAYTGADRKRDGYFQRADGGTLFLDEVGETPLEVQVLLLRALETQEIQPVGGEEFRRVDVRLIAATDSDLEQAVAAGRFRAPLLHRLAGYEIRIPPLRQRRDDFGRLFFHFLREELAGHGDASRLATPPDERPWVPPALVARLAELDWPGNVRQLRNAVRQIVIAGRDAGEPGMWLQAERLFQESARATGLDEGPTRDAPLEHPPQPAKRKSYRSPEDVTDDELITALRAHRWRIQRAAAELGISRGSLYDRIEKSPRIKKAADLSSEEIQEHWQRCGGDLDAMVEGLEVSKRGLQRRMTQLGIPRKS
ncbi:MAG TPA: sigma 54-interacting transcriptional regulator [Thermoanaerobaculia bacterium]|nr:sigma 54-interacting transcriptional regulator [Thermoanaerobaculia bacterium]